MTSNYPKTRYHIILPGPDGIRALALADGDSYALPGWSSSEDTFWQETSEINRGVRDLLGVQVAMLRACRLDRSEQVRDRYYIVEALDSAWELPDGARWVDATTINQVAWRIPTDREVLDNWFNDRSPSKRVPWYRPGWFASARRWIERQIILAGLTRTGEVEQLRSWERSSIMRVETGGGQLYFKAVAPQWGHEPGLTRYLAKRFPQLMPSVVAADPSSGRMLAREFDGTSLPDCSDHSTWRRAYAALGMVQRELVDAVADLRDLGVPYRDLDTISREIPEMLSDRRRMRVGMQGGLTDEDVARLQAAEQAILDACRRLAGGPIPLSLDHGDFWPGNVYAGPEKITLFDWSDATITHPFFSLVMAADEVADCFPDQPGASQQVIDAYLAEWTAYGSMDELRALFDDAMLVAPLHQAIMYRSFYLPAMEFVDELDRMTPHFLRWLARRVGSR